MADSSLQEQLTKYLTDAHSIEEQALAQLEAAPRIAGDPELAGIFQEHLGETRGHESMTRTRLEALGADTSTIKDMVMKAGGAGFLLFAKSQPDTPGKLVAHAYSYEHMELAAYELLGRVAERAGDEETVQLAKAIRDQEQAMAERLASNFDRSVAASLEDVGREDMLEQLRKYLADAHAIEAQAIKLLEKGPELASDPELSSLFEEHLVETRDQQELVDARLEALGGEPSMLKDLAMKAGAINWGTFFAAHPDTPGKLVAFAYAFEHLEIAGYEQLRRVAEQVGDGETADMAARILEQERNAAEKLAASFDRAVEASLRAQGITA
jgi:ferritin-like metal-binding protein YciE